MSGSTIVNRAGSFHPEFLDQLLDYLLTITLIPDFRMGRRQRRGGEGDRLPHGCYLLHVVQPRRVAARHHQQGQEAACHRAAKGHRTIC